MYVLFNYYIPMYSYLLIVKINNLVFRTILLTIEYYRTILLTCTI